MTRPLPLAAAAAALTAAVAAAAPIPKLPAEVAGIRDRFGTPVDPTGRCRFELTDGTALAIHVPAADLTLDPGNMAAPRAVKPVAGDFEARVRVTAPVDTDAAPPGKEGAGVGGGLVILAGPDDPGKEPTHVVELRQRHFRPGGRPGGQWCSPYEFAARFPPDTDWGGIGPQKRDRRPMHLKLVRTAGTVTGWWSYDGDRWAKANAGLDAIPLPDAVRVGVYAVQTTAKPAAVRFDGYAVAPLKPDRPAD